MIGCLKVHFQVPFSSQVHIQLTSVAVMMTHTSSISTLKHFCLLLIHAKRQYLDVDGDHAAAHLLSVYGCHN